MAVDNEGVSGERTAPMLSRLKRKKKIHLRRHTGGHERSGHTNVREHCGEEYYQNAFVLFEALGVQRSFCLSLPEVVLNSKKRFERKRKALTRSCVHCQTTTRRCLCTVRRIRRNAYQIVVFGQRLAFV